MRFLRAIGLAMVAAMVAGWNAPSAAQEKVPIDFANDVMPILRKYCVGCHNDADAEGQLSLESHRSIGRGGKRGAVLVPGSSANSRLLRVLTGKTEPRMPPKDNEAPGEHELAVLASWIDAGAAGPTGAMADPTRLIVPKIKLRAPAPRAVRSAALSGNGELLAVAYFQEVEVLRIRDRSVLHRFNTDRGNLNSISFSADGQSLVSAGGEPGLVGEVRIWDLHSGQLEREFLGHRDSLYAARLSPDGRLLATGGYDQRIKIWDRPSGQELRTLDGHNGPVFDLAFHPRGDILASASGDRTVKLWDLSSGARLDTLNQSLQELYCVAFAPDGRSLAAGGVDNRIRVWTISDSAKEGSNPLRVSQFAHELPVIRIAYSQDGRTLASSGEDRMVKVWDAETMEIRATLPPQPDWPVGLALAPSGGSAFVGRLDGTAEQYQFSAEPRAASEHPTPTAEVPPCVDYGPQPPIDQLPTLSESEPNDAPAAAADLPLPGIARGKIWSTQSGAIDADWYRFQARQSDQWVFETNAARKNSPVDTKIEILSAAGNPVPRLLLRAVRDSEVEFRGMDSNQRGVRLKNWEEMYLNEYVYIEGEVIKHFQQRRGPDADSQFYPENGSRISFFETSSRAHALGQPSYVVVPYPVGTALPNNGLPTFVLNFENDDDGQRKLGKDSRVTFVAPADGVYFVRVTDVRGASGENFEYELIARRPTPGFRVSLNPRNPTVNVAGGKAFTVKADRIDNFMGPIRVDLNDLPPGYTATSPIIIQAGLYEAKGVLNALPGAVAPDEAASKAVRVAAIADIAGKQTVQEVESLGTINQAAQAKLRVFLEIDPANPDSVPATAAADPLSAPQPAQVSIAPGRRTTCKIRIERLGFDDRVQLEIENLPHGVIVDDIGLNGILIPEGQTERIIFLNCEPWVPQTSRPFFAVAKVEGDQASLPMLLHVK